METIGGVITHVSGQLNDQQRGRKFTRWTRTTLLEYMNQALKEIGAYRPEAFGSATTIVLVTGAQQTLPVGTTLVTLGPNVNGQPIATVDDKILKAYGAYAACVSKPVFKNGNIQYQIRSFAVDSDNPNTFYVSPPVPSGVEISVPATTYGAAPEYTQADWDKKLFLADKFYNNMLDFMLARAYQLDSESQVSQAQAQRLFQLFYQAMGTKYRIDAAKQSGYYLGEIGTGDSRSIVR